MNRMIFFGEASLRRAIREYVSYYHGERNHQGLENRLLRPAANDSDFQEGAVTRRSRLGGLLSYYYREAV